MDLSNGIMDYLLVFGTGIVLSFTPCIYPVIPVTAGFIASLNTKGTKIMGFILSLFYVLGMAVTYCSFAVFAALTGRVFGQLQNHYVVYFLISFVIFFFALGMLDLVKIPQMGINIQTKVKKRNIGTVIFLGMVAGLIVGPCTAPVLGTLLVYIGSKQNILHGVSLMFVFACGLGTSLILVGTFSGLLSSLPKSGKWLGIVKKICGLVLLAIAVYYLRGAIILLM